MGMREHPGHAYAIEVDKLIAFLPAEVRDSAEAFKDDFDFDQLLEAINRSLPPAFPRVESILHLGDEDSSHDLDLGEVYATFAESDLFECKPTSFLLTLREAGAEPTEASFSMWG